MQEFFWKKDLQSYQHLFLDMLMVFMVGTNNISNGDSI